MNTEELCALMKSLRNTNKWEPIEKLECVDGFKLSVQASEYHYCAPRESNLGYYHLVEVGYPSEEEPMLMEYAEEPSKPTDTVYAYVPTTLVVEVITKHGGIKL